MTNDTTALRGTLYGENRAAILKQAHERAEAYFGTSCVSVKLENSRPNKVLTGFNAEFTAVEWHNVQSRTYGPAQCLGCRRDSWPQHPLNVVAREEWR